MIALASAGAEAAPAAARAAGAVLVAGPAQGGAVAGAGQTAGGNCMEKSDTSIIVEFRVYGTDLLKL